MAGNGIADLLGNKLTLEERIIECVSGVPTDADLKESYTDAEDRARVINRSRIAALLTAVFEHNSDDMAEEEEGAEIKTSAFGHLADILRSFSHDAERLDNGLEASLVLAPVGRESIQPKQLIKANRKRLLHWLVLIKLWNPAKDTEFPTQKLLLKKAADELGSTEGSLKANLSRLHAAIKEYGRTSGSSQSSPKETRFSTVEIEFCLDLEELCRKITTSSDEPASPFALLRPALKALKKKPI
jgi:hypothetical protein